MIGKVLGTANVKHKNWKQGLYKFFGNYRANSHTNTVKSTAKIMFPNRVLKTRIPDFIDNKDEVKDEDILKKDAQEKGKIKYMLTNEIMQNHATLVLETKLLLEHGKRTRVYVIIIQTFIPFSCRFG